MALVRHHQWNSSLRRKWRRDPFRVHGGRLAIESLEDRLVLALIGVDFVIDDPSPVNWNVFDLSGTPPSGTTLNNLIREDGQVTPVDITATSPRGTIGAGDFGVIPSEELPAHTQSLQDLQDYANDVSEPLTFTFGDLVPFAPYDVYVFGHRHFDNTQDVTITGAGAPVMFTQTHAADGLAVNGEAGSSSRSLRSYAETVLASSTGTIEILIEPVTSSAVGGVAIEESPFAAPPLVAVDFVFDDPSPVNWNAFNLGVPSGTTISDLVREDGLITAIDLTVEDPDGAISAGNHGSDAIDPAQQPIHNQPLTDVQDYAFDSDDTMRFAFSDLVPFVSYDVFVFGSRITVNSQNVTIDGNDGPVTFTQTMGADDLFINGELGDSERTLDSYAVTVRATAAGEIEIVVTEDTPADAVAVAGLAIRETPQVPPPLIGVDFNFSDGTPLGWNDLDLSGSVPSPSTLSNLIREDGVTSGVDLTVTDPDGLVQSSPHIFPIDPGQLPIHTRALDRLQDYAFDQVSQNYTFSDLAPFASYDVFVFGSRVSLNSQNVTITGSGLPIEFTQTVSGNEMFINDQLGDSLRSLDSYAIRVNASATGTIDIEVEEATAADVVSVAGLAIRATPVASPALVGVDFFTNDAAPTNWNAFDTGGSPPSGTSLANLQREDGSGTPFELAILDPDGVIASGNQFVDALAPNQLPIHRQPLRNLQDYTFDNDGPMTFVFSELEPLVRYDVFVFGSRGTFNTQDVTITGDGTPVAFQQSFGPNELYVNGLPGSNNRTLDSYAIPVAADALGSIRIVVEGATGPDVVSVAGLALCETPITPPNLVGVDFAVESASPHNWTALDVSPFFPSGTLLPDLLREDGRSTPFDLTITNINGGAVSFGPQEPDEIPNNQLPLHDQPLTNVQDYAFTLDNSVEFAFGDLTPFARYDLFVFGSRSFDNSQDVTITGSGSPIQFTQSFDATELFINRELGDSSRPLDSYAVRAVASAAGIIDILVEQTTQSDVVSVAGLAIRQVPQVPPPLVGVDFVFNDPSPTNWNPFDLANIPDSGTSEWNLIREDGTVTAFDVVVLDPDGTLGNGNHGTTAIPSSQLPIHTQPLPNVQDYLFELDDPVTIDFFDLVPGARYDVFVFGSRVAANTQDITILGAGAPTMFRQSFAGNNLFINDQIGNSARSLGSYAIEVTATVSGRIRVMAEEATPGDVVSIAAVAVRESMPNGDFDNNGVYECADVDALVAEIVAGSHQLQFDLTGDGSVNLNDLNEWLILAGAAPGSPTGGNPFLPADANLDSVVDGQDFIIWNSNKFMPVQGFCSGDFNADGVADGQDFIIWNAFKFMSADGALLDDPGVIDHHRLASSPGATLRPVFDLPIDVFPAAQPERMFTSLVDAGDGTAAAGAAPDMVQARVTKPYSAGYVGAAEASYQGDDNHETSIARLRERQLDSVFAATDGWD